MRYFYADADHRTVGPSAIAMFSADALSAKLVRWTALFSNGITPGRWMQGLHVIDDSGGAAGFFAS